ncbi:thioredoxin domain-containing protein [Croceiramulus getboli]|nr:thioredoxin domain-containing protein [Flavobacteriaceae bacterium YJPT1-3]
MRILALLAVLLSLTACTHSSDTMDHAYTNALVDETSPYLLQHAHNPVDWHPWKESVLEEAEQDNKLLLISVGYSACHWCHVMERESFEDTAVAKLMNTHFMNIKVDREERPDVDQVYMNAVQLMTGRGGWPLNVVALPDGRPVWGGTYLPKEDWVSALSQIAKLYEDEPERLVEYASRLEEGLKTMDLVEPNPTSPRFSQDTLSKAVRQWSMNFDTRLGGPKQAPKFMMPANLNFLLRYAHQTENDSLLDYVNTTLTQMAYGGLYDQVGGGFSRYSTDVKWHVPHFEKMLYDNALLTTLYSEAYLKTKDPLYKETVYGTIDFVLENWADPEGGFYAALDADSKTESGALEEGAYYVWTREELESIIDDFPLFAAYYNINDYGYWENDLYVLIRQDSDVDFAAEHGLSVTEVKSKVKQWKSKLGRFRESRPAPRMDDKMLTGWNGLMTKGLLDAYRVFQEPRFLSAAKKNAQFIVDQQMRDDGGLNRNYKNGTSSINAYLEDYAATIQAFLALFETTGEHSWLTHASDLTDYVMEHFSDDKTQLFFFTSDQDANLVVRQMEYRDNVIPASNSIMAKNLFQLAHYTLNPEYADRARKMLNNVQDELTTYPSGFGNWLDLYLNYTHPYYEVVITGPQAKAYLEQLNGQYLPNTLKAATTQESDLIIFEGRVQSSRTAVFVCVDNSCKLPVYSVAEALPLLKN